MLWQKHKCYGADGKDEDAKVLRRVEAKSEWCQEMVCGQVINPVVEAAYISYAANRRRRYWQQGQMTLFRTPYLMSNGSG